MTNYEHIRRCNIISVKSDPNPAQSSNTLCNILNETSGNTSPALDATVASRSVQQ